MLLTDQLPFFFYFRLCNDPIVSTLLVMKNDIENETFSPLRNENLFRAVTSSFAACLKSQQLPAAGLCAWREADGLARTVAAPLNFGVLQPRPITDLFAAASTLWFSAIFTDRMSSLTFDALFMSVLTFKGLFESWVFPKHFDSWHLFSMVMSLRCWDNKSHCVRVRFPAFFFPFCWSQIRKWSEAVQKRYVGSVSLLSDWTAAWVLWAIHETPEGSRLKSFKDHCRKPCVKIKKNISLALNIFSPVFTASSWNSRILRYKALFDLSHVELAGGKAKVIYMASWFFHWACDVTVVKLPGLNIFIPVFLEVFS